MQDLGPAASEPVAATSTADVMVDTQCPGLDPITTTAADTVAHETDTILAKLLPAVRLKFAAPSPNSSSSSTKLRGKRLLHVAVYALTKAGAAADETMMLAQMLAGTTKADKPKPPHM